MRDRLSNIGNSYQGTQKLYLLHCSVCSVTLRRPAVKKYRANYYPLKYLQNAWFSVLA